MNTIQSQLKEDLKTAMRQRKENPARLDLVRMIVDRIQKREKETQTELTHDEVIQVIQTLKKQIGEEIDGFEKAGNVNQVNKLNNDLNMINAYLPQQMSREEVVTIIVQAISNDPNLNGRVYNKGTVMKAVMPFLKGKADNKMISEVVTEVITEQNK